MADSRCVCRVGGDLEIFVKERYYDQGTGQDGRWQLKETASMMVSRACLQRYTSLLDTTAGNHGRAEGSRLVIDGESITAVKVWMEVLHRQIPQATNINIKDVWWAIHFGNKYLLERKEGAELTDPDTENNEDALKPAKDMSLLSGWFTRYYNMHEKYFKEKDDRGKLRAFSVLAPAYWFDCPQIFLDVTRHIAYNTAGHIENDNPTECTDQYMRGVPGRALVQLSAARGSQRGRLEKFLPRASAPCPDHEGECRDVMVFSHKKSLLKTGIKSLFSLADRKRTLNELLDNLDEYEFSLVSIRSWHGQQSINPSWSTKLCKHCSHSLFPTAKSLTSQVLRASKNVRKNFGGLCLDCMHKFKTEGDDGDYFSHDQPGQHDHGCRVKHGQPTWYFSYMGRKELMLRHQGRLAEECRERKRELKERVGA
ncbi:hypothetical protein O1611_g6482 [Lasiodiplodia mahajangana]|uniref:Uncharacterized protein n=1 Tax=Lasiodiplodia mahajangana TaxID=1108764 RepID=A0ACC2JIN7_9PEZI|nr:hypothetical protein O1611_g6482 [Lasiodiplodia mahajangana]